MRRKVCFSILGNAAAECLLLCNAHCRWQSLLMAANQLHSFAVADMFVPVFSGNGLV